MRRPLALLSSILLYATSTSDATPMQLTPLRPIPKEQTFIPKQKNTLEFFILPTRCRQVEFATNVPTRIEFCPDYIEIEQIPTQPYERALNCLMVKSPTGWQTEFVTVVTQNRLGEYQVPFVWGKDSSENVFADAPFVYKNLHHICTKHLWTLLHSGYFE